MRIAAVSLANYTYINSKNRRSVNKNPNSTDVFVKSQPSFGNLTRLVEIKEEYLLPLMKKYEPEWKHLNNLLEVNDKNNLAIAISKAKLTELIYQPFKNSGLDIFSLVDDKLKFFDEYIQNKNIFSSISEKAKDNIYYGKNENIQKEINSAQYLFAEEPQIITELRPLALTRKQTNVDIKNGLKNVDVPNLEYPREDMVISYLVAKNPYSSAERLVRQIDGYAEALNLGEAPSEDVINVLYRKLHLVSEEEKQYRLRSASINNSVLDLKPAVYDLEEFDKNIKLSINHAKRIITRNAGKLDNIFRTKYAFKPQTSPELDSLLYMQKNSNNKLNKILQARFNELLEQNAKNSEQFRYNKIDDDLPF